MGNPIVSYALPLLADTAAVRPYTHAMDETDTDRRKRLTFRSWHRGTKEADMLLGRFADVHLATLSQDQLARYEALLENPDPDLYAWVTDLRPVPAEFDTDIMALLKQVQNGPLSD
jgi:antitoxin CptB